MISELKLQDYRYPERLSEPTKLYRLVINYKFICSLARIIKDAIQQYLYREEHGLFQPAVHRKHFFPTLGLFLSYK